MTGVNTKYKKGGRYIRIRRPAGVLLLVYVLCLDVIFPSARIFTNPPSPPPLPSPPPPLPLPPPTSYHIMKTKIIQDIDVADRPAMFSLTSCLAPAFCFLFRMVLSIVKRHSLISRRALWMSFASAYVCCCLIHTCQPLVLLHSLPLRPFPLLISYQIKACNSACTTLSWNTLNARRSWATDTTGASCLHTQLTAEFNTVCNAALKATAPNAPTACSTSSV